MTKMTVNLTATPSEGVQMYSITVHNQAVKTTNGRGSIQLDSPGDYKVTYQFIGSGGDTLSISGDAGGKSFPIVKKSEIPAGEHAGVGRARFAI